MSDFDALYGSRFLQATDLSAPVTAVIERVETEQFTRPGEPTRSKAVLFFKGGKKGMVVNKTNASALASAFGKPFTGWVGKRVTIKAEPTTFGGKVTKGLRTYPAIERNDRITSGPIRPPEPPSAADDMNDSIPF
jgi:hypothetical protein